MPKEYLSVQQVAQQLDVHRETVLRAIAQGKLKATQIGRGYRIQQKDVDAYVENQTVKVK